MFTGFDVQRLCTLDSNVSGNVKTCSTGGRYQDARVLVRVRRDMLEFGWRLC